MLQILAMLSQCATPTKCTRGCLLQHRVLKLHNFSVYGDSIPLMVHMHSIYMYMYGTWIPYYIHVCPQCDHFSKINSVISHLHVHVFEWLDLVHSIPAFKTRIIPFLVSSTSSNTNAPVMDIRAMAMYLCRKEI